MKLVTGAHGRKYVILEKKETQAGLQLTRVKDGWAVSSGVYRISGPTEAMRTALSVLNVELEDLLDDDEHSSFAGSMKDGQITISHMTLHFECNELEEDWT